MLLANSLKFGLMLFLCFGESSEFFFKKKPLITWLLKHKANQLHKNGTIAKTTTTTTTLEPSIETTSETTSDNAGAGTELRGDSAGPQDESSTSVSGNETTPGDGDAVTTTTQESSTEIATNNSTDATTSIPKAPDSGNPSEALPLSASASQNRQKSTTNANAKPKTPPSSPKPANQAKKKPPAKPATTTTQRPVNAQRRTKRENVPLAKRQTTAAKYAGSSRNAMKMIVSTAKPKQKHLCRRKCNKCPKSTTKPKSPTPLSPSQPTPASPFILITEKPQLQIEKATPKQKTKTILDAPSCRVGQLMVDNKCVDEV